MAGPTISISISRPDGISVRDHNSYLRTANRETARFHHKKHIPRHFERFAAAKYGYAPRRSRVRRNLTYQQLKDRLGLPPLVSPRVTGGTTKQVVTTQRRITATRTQARLIMRLPFRGGTGRLRLLPGQRRLTPQQKVIRQLVDEIETISDDEQRTLNKMIADRYAAQARRRLATKQRHKKIV